MTAAKKKKISFNELERRARKAQHEISSTRFASTLGLSENFIFEVSNVSRWPLRLKHILEIPDYSEFTAADLQLWDL